MKYFMIFLMMFFASFTVKAAVIGNKDVQVMEYVYDFAVQGGAVGFIDLTTRLNNALPANAAILRVSYYVQTSLSSANSGGSATVALGDYSSGTRFLDATAYDNAAFADEKLAAISDSNLPNLVDSANEGKIGITVGTAALTAGKISIIVEYVQVKR